MRCNLVVCYSMICKKEEVQQQFRKQTGHARAVGKHGALGPKNDTFYKDITNSRCMGTTCAITKPHS